MLLFKIKELSKTIDEYNKDLQFSNDDSTIKILKSSISEAKEKIKLATNNAISECKKLFANNYNFLDCYFDDTNKDIQIILKFKDFSAHYIHNISKLAEDEPITNCTSEWQFYNNDYESITPDETLLKDIKEKLIYIEKYIA